MENVKKKFLRSHFLQRDHQGFLKDVEVWLIDKTQAFFSNFFSIFFQTTQQKHYLK